jgi:tRNA (guanine10-N2)-dimethyltransferase
MELLCIQSQEHPELPLAELKAVMECENIEATVDAVTEGLVILRDIPSDKLYEYYNILTRRLGYTHEVHEFITKSNINDLTEDLSAIDWCEYIDETFAVRVKRIRSDIDTVGTERDIGTLILNNCDKIKVNRLISANDPISIV